VYNEEIENDLGVDQIRRKLSFSESRQHKSSDATQVKHSEQLGRSNASKQQSKITSLFYYFTVGIV